MARFLDNASDIKKSVSKPKKKKKKQGDYTAEGAVSFCV